MLEREDAANGPITFVNDIPSQ